MEIIIAGTILLTASNLYVLYKLRKERQQYTKSQAKLKKQRDMLSQEIEEVELKLNELEDLVFEHVSTLEEQDMAAFDIPCAQPLIRWVGTKRQVAAARAALGE